jgi:DNA-binding XRE family transcriptional regulator
MSYKAKSLGVGFMETKTTKRDESQTSQARNGSNKPDLSYTKHIPISFSFDTGRPPMPPKDVSSRFGMKLRLLRREHRWTQLQMAVTLGINRSYISEIERGHKSISLGMLEIIALGFDMSIAELLHGI